MWVEVKNVNNTSKERYKNPPLGYSSWKDYWQTNKGRDFGVCANKDCSNDADRGGHVKKVGMGDDRWYITPLCAACNNKPEGEVFEVWDKDLYPVTP